MKTNLRGLSGWPSHVCISHIIAACAKFDYPVFVFLSFNVPISHSFRDRVELGKKPLSICSIISSLFSKFVRNHGLINLHYYVWYFLSQSSSSSFFFCFLQVFFSCVHKLAVFFDLLIYYACLLVRLLTCPLTSAVSFVFLCHAQCPQCLHHSMLR